MPYCRIRTSKLTFVELWRMHNWSGFIVVGGLKLFRRDFPSSDTFLIPSYWRDMAIDPNDLSRDCISILATTAEALTLSGGAAWGYRYFRRPHAAHSIEDAGGALFCLPGGRSTVMHVYARGNDASVSSCIYVASSYSSGHTISTTNSSSAFAVVPGSRQYFHRCGVLDLLRHHEEAIRSDTKLTVFQSIEDAIIAHDRKEELQSAWDIARGAFEPNGNA